MTKKKDYCHEYMIKLLAENGGEMPRSELRKKLFENGYKKYCIYQAFRRLENNDIIKYNGSGYLKSQIVYLVKSEEI